MLHVVKEVMTYLLHEACFLQSDCMFPVRPQNHFYCHFLLRQSGWGQRSDILLFVKLYVLPKILYFISGKS